MYVHFNPQNSYQPDDVCKFIKKMLGERVFIKSEWGRLIGDGTIEFVVLKNKGRSPDQADNIREKSFVHYLYIIEIYGAFESKDSLIELVEKLVHAFWNEGIPAVVMPDDEHDIPEWGYTDPPPWLEKYQEKVKAEMVQQQKLKEARKRREQFIRNPFKSLLAFFKA